jgi:hypothetical protein
MNKHVEECELAGTDQASRATSQSAAAVFTERRRERSQADESGKEGDPGIVGFG